MQPAVCAIARPSKLRFYSTGDKESILKGIKEIFTDI